jgi:hypothetical protein
MKQTIASARKVAALIPHAQYAVTIELGEAFGKALGRLEKQLEQCPKLGETDGKKNTPPCFITSAAARIYMSVSSTERILCSVLPF